MPVRDAFARMILLITWLQSGGHTVAQLRRRLCAEGCEVSERTVRRDLLYLGLPPLSCPLYSESRVWFWGGDPEKWSWQKALCKRSTDVQCE